MAHHPPLPPLLPPPPPHRRRRPGGVRKTDGRRRGGKNYPGQKQQHERRPPGRSPPGVQGSSSYRHSHRPAPGPSHRSARLPKPSWRPHKPKNLSLALQPPTTRPADFSLLDNLFLASAGPQPTSTTSPTSLPRLLNSMYTASRFWYSHRRFDAPIPSVALIPGSYGLFRPRQPRTSLLLSSSGRRRPLD